MWACSSPGDNLSGLPNPDPRLDPARNGDVDMVHGLHRPPSHCSLMETRSDWPDLQVEHQYQIQEICTGKYATGTIAFLTKICHA